MEWFGVFDGEPAMSQSRAWSLGETCFSTAVGFVIAYATTALVMPVFGYPVTVADNLGITAIFTAVSIVRGYCIRRLFTWINS